MTAQSTAAHPWVVESQQRPRFGLLLGGSPDWSALRHIAQTAEAIGFDSLWIPDHPVLSPSSSWTTLAALAEGTRTVRVGTLVSCAFFRHPVVLAGEVAEVDRISGGRVVLGLGSGDAPEEFRRMGLPCPPIGRRQEALEEILQIVPPLLAGKTVSYSGKDFEVADARLAQPALQQPHVPVLVAGGGAQTMLRLVATYADACNIGAASWAGGGFTGEDARHKFDGAALLDAHFVDDGKLVLGVKSGAGPGYTYRLPAYPPHRCGHIMSGLRGHTSASLGSSRRVLRAGRRRGALRGDINSGLA